MCMYMCMHMYMLYMRAPRARDMHMLMQALHMHAWNPHTYHSPCPSM